MFDLSNANIVKRGACLYDGVKPYQVIVVESERMYGSGDYEDPPEIREDRMVRCYYAWFESLPEQGVFNSSCGPFLSLEEAASELARKYTVAWEYTGGAAAER